MIVAINSFPSSTENNAGHANEEIDGQVRWRYPVINLYTCNPCSSKT